MRAAAIAAMVLVATPSISAAGIDLSWNHCVTSSPADDITFSCAPGALSNLYANFQLPSSIPSFVALDAVIDVQLASAVPPFWEFQTGGCNSSNLQIFDDRPAEDCPAAGNATPWGPGGSFSDAFIDAYSPGYGGTNRARMILTVARASSSPTPLTAGTNYYGFHLRFSSDSSATCTGCSMPGEITWTSAVFYSVSPIASLEVTAAGLRSKTVTVNGGLAGVIGFEIFAVSPTRAAPGPGVAITAYGRSIAPGAVLTLERSGESSIVATGVTVATDGRTISGTVDLTNAFDGTWDVVVVNPGGASSRISAGFVVDAPLTLSGIAPSSIADTGTFPTTITGAGFEAGIQVLLHRQFSADIVGTVTGIALNKKSMNVTFGTNHTVVGAWDLVASISGVETATLPGAVQVVSQPQAYRVTPNVIGDDRAVSFVIDGNNLSGVDVVRFEKVGQAPRAASAITHVDNLTLRATVDFTGAASGPWDIVVSAATLSGRTANILQVTTSAVLDSIVPAQAGNGEPFDVTVYGRKFLPGMTIDLRAGSDALHATNVVVAADGRSATGTFSPPSNATGPRDVVVFNSGIASNVLVAGFTLLSAPHIDYVTPSQGSTGSITLRASGRGFFAGATAKLAHAGLPDRLGTGVVVGPSDTSLTATFDITGAIPGPWDFVVRGANGLQGRLVGGFTVIATPAIDSIAPDHGPNQASDFRCSVYGLRMSSSLRVELLGSGFTRTGTVLNVLPDGTRADVSFNLVGLGVSPPRYDVRVTNLPGGTATLAAAFSVLASPTISSITPHVGVDTTRAQTITLTGTRFLSGATFRLILGGLLVIDGTNVQVGGGGGTLSATFDLRGAAEGFWDVSVLNPDGSSITAGSGFQVDLVPSLTLIDPNRGADNEVQAVTVFGSHIGSGSQLSLTRSSGASISAVAESVSPDRIRLMANIDLLNAALGLWSVKVVNATGTASATLVDAFTVIAGPRITSIVPTSAEPIPSVNATVRGTGFLVGADVNLEHVGVPVIQAENEITSSDGTQITFQLPLAGAPLGPRDVIVYNPDGRIAKLTNGFTILTGPSIRWVSPTSAPDTGTVYLSITGNGFNASATVRLQRFGQPDILPTQTTVSPGASAILAVFDLRGKALGTWDVAVQNPGGASAVLSGAFEITHTGTAFPSGLDLTWDACNLPSTSGSTASTFDCGDPGFVKTLYANFQSPFSLPDFVALDAVIDVELGSSSVPDFWRYDLVGCNPAALPLLDGMPATACPAASNHNPWGPGGSAADAFITAYVPDYPMSGRARMLLSVVRASNNPFSIVGGENYYGFHLTWTGDLTVCSGCSTPAEITWTSALLHSAGSSSPTLVSGPGLRTNHVSLNGGLAGLGVTSVVPDHVLLGGFARVQVVGRDLVGVTGASLVRSGFPDIPGTALAVAPSGGSLVATFDLTGAASGPWGVRVTRGAQTATLDNGLRLISNIPEVRLLSPNGDEAFIINQNADVVWEAVDDKSVTSIDLYVSRNGGPWEIVQLDLPNSGAYGWRVNAPPTGSASMLIVAHDADGNEGTDQNDRPFRIILNPTATLLERFDAARVSDGVEVRWRFQSPEKIATAQLDRAPADVGPWSAVAAPPRTQDGVTVVLDRDPAAGASRYRLRATTRDGQSLTFGPVSAPAAPVDVGVSGVTAIVPNPAASRTRIQLVVAREAAVRLSVLDLQGREVRVLVDGTLGAGPHEIVWDARAGGRNLPAGLYFVRFVDPTRRQVTRLALAP